MRVYVAGPVHGSGNQSINVYKAVSLGREIVKAGHVPFVPHLFTLWETMFAVEDQTEFMTMCVEWVNMCNALVRLPGVSPGSEMEVSLARAAEIPVLELSEGFSINDVVSFLESVKPAMVTIDDFQNRVKSWLKKQPQRMSATPEVSALGVVEEIGELRESCLEAASIRTSHIAKALLKKSQGIKGTPEEHNAAIADAVGDTCVFAAGFCHASGISLSGSLKSAITEIESRDWSKFPINGKTE